MALGLLLAVFGPLLLLPVVWAVYRWPFRRPRTGSLALVVAMVIASWLPGRIDFARLCEAHAQPVIAERVDAARAAACVIRSAPTAG